MIKSELSNTCIYTDPLDQWKLNKHKEFQSAAAHIWVHQVSFEDILSEGLHHKTQPCELGQYLRSAEEQNIQVCNAKTMFYNLSVYSFRYTLCSFKKVHTNYIVQSLLILYLS